MDRLSVPMPPTRKGTTATILLADGNAGDRTELRRIFERDGFSVSETASAEPPDLIVLHSADLCRAFRQDPLTRHIPILQLHSPHARHSAPEAAPDACLTAPAEPAAMIAVARALVRARRAEQREDGTGRTFRAALEAIGCCALMLDSSGMIRQVNRAVCELIGRPEEDLIGKHYLEVAPGITESEAELPFDRARRTLGRQFAELQAGGRSFRVEVYPLLDGNGAFAGALRTIEDITDRQSAERDRERLVSQLASERARLETVLQQMPAGVIMAEAPSGKLVLINGRVESIFRGPFRIGGGIEDYFQYQAFRPNGRPYKPDEHPLARTIRDGEVITDEEMEVVRADGTRAAVLVSSAPIRNSEGAILAGALTFHDVTERTQLEHQLRQAQKMEAMGRLAGGVAHDFNNLLTVIGGYGQMVRDALDPKSPLRRDLDAILEASDRASTLTRQLLTFSRRQMVEPRVLDLNRNISRISRMLRRVIREDIELVTLLKADPARVKADPAQIEQVLMNIAVNAKDAMPKGGKLTVETAFVEIAEEAEALDGLKPGQYVALSMTDTGTGMDAETQSHLFEPFFTTKSKGKGTGLGLSTVYGIVKQNGGEIVISSELGRGTAVRMYFPLAEERVKSGGGAGRRPAERPGSETILVVEDDAEVRKLAAEMLSRQGYTVLEAASGPEALRVWKQHASSIDLILTDVVMPSMAGPELAAKLMAERADLKVLYMSGYPEDVMAKHGLTASESTFVHKPFTSDALIHSVRLVLDAEHDER
ncbi:MAG TPA: response regulator [Bryobacteraceae bacterium]|nr:response regulator [Bryobacteraceae bacterium]